MPMKVVPDCHLIRVRRFWCLQQHKMKKREEGGRKMMMIKVSHMRYWTRFAWGQVEEDGDHIQMKSIFGLSIHKEIKVFHIA